MSREEYYQNLGQFIDSLLRENAGDIGEQHPPYVMLYDNPTTFFEKDYDLVKNLSVDAKLTAQSLASAIIFNASLWNYEFRRRDFDLHMSGDCLDEPIRLNGYLGDGHKIHNDVIIQKTSEINLNPKPELFRFKLILDTPSEAIPVNPLIECHIVNATVSRTDNFNPLIVADNVLIILPGSEVNVTWADDNDPNFVNLRRILLTGYINLNEDQRCIFLSFTQEQNSLFGHYHSAPLLPVLDPPTNPGKQTKPSE